MSNTFVSEQRNDTYSYLRGADLQDLLTAVNNFNFAYRESLNLPEYITFGAEIEYEGIRKNNVSIFIEKKLPGWRSVDDGSLTSGGEINSPIMTDKFKYWSELKKICDFLSKNDADTLHNAAGHIHIGANVFGDNYKAWRFFLKLYIAYEHVLFRFLYGDKISARKKIMRYAAPFADEARTLLSGINNARHISDMGYLLPRQKHSALNFCHVSFGVSHKYYGNTLEFRSPNATVNEIIWQNNINALAKMVLSSVEQVMDEDFLNYKLQHEFFSYEKNPDAYNEVILKSVLEFVDLVFDNNLDKVYFLKQYLKEFENNFGLDHAVFAKTFVK